MLWIILSLLALWAAVGWFLKNREARPSGVHYRRTVNRSVVAVGEEVEVDLWLLPPTVAAETVEEQDVVLVLDRSGSMGCGPASALGDALVAARRFVERCPRQIRVGIVTFDGWASLACPVTDDPKHLLAAIGGVRSGGSTAIHCALDCAREALEGGRPEVAKTVILLSDGGSVRRAAERAAETLRAAHPQASILCVGLGSAVDESLLTAVAGSKQGYCHVTDSDQLGELFTFFAAALHSETAQAVSVDEGARAPSPFRLSGTGRPHPAGVRPQKDTRLLWASPVLTPRPLELQYRLTAECPGWHRVASPDASARWHLPDGSEQREGGPEGPRVLVLPALLTWAWPVLNPLFFLLFGRYFCRATPVETMPEVAADDLASSERSLPEPLPPVEVSHYRPRLRPALILGHGEVGERALGHLLDRLRDRDLSGDEVEHWQLDVGHSGRSTNNGVRGIDPSRRIVLQGDYRPYLEGLRQQGGAPATRSWIPWQSWLAEAPALTSQGPIVADRRLARLALLQQGTEVESRLRPALERASQRDGLVILVGAADDPVASGLVAEVAHLCATSGLGVTALLARGDTPASGGGVAALERELTRFVALRGDPVTSDRAEPPPAARQLFDRIVIVPSAAAGSAAPAAELIWSLLAYERVFEQLPTTRMVADEAQVVRAVIDAEALPTGSLWRWLRERTLAREINGGLLGLEAVQGELCPPAVEAHEVAAQVKAFWRPPTDAVPQGTLASLVPDLLERSNPVALLLGPLPAESMHHEQVELHRAERRAFLAASRHWCQALLERRRPWGMPLAAAALEQVERDLGRIVQALEQYRADERFGELARLGADLYADHLALVSRLRRQLESWILALTGPGDEALCHRLETARQEAEADFSMPRDLDPAELATRADEWADLYGRSLSERLAFDWRLDSGGGFLGLGLRLGDEPLPRDATLLDALRRALDDYRGTVLSGWAEPAANARQVSNPRDSLRVGARSAELFPSIERVVDDEDPRYGAAIELRQMPLASALDVVRSDLAQLPFAWPEEANAARIRGRIRDSSLRREPRPFEPLAVHLLRDPTELWSAMAAWAQGDLESSGGDTYLRRAGRRYRVGEANTDETDLEQLEAVLRRVVALRTSLDGEPIPSPDTVWEAGPEDAVRAVEAHPRIVAAVADPGWAMWRDVIRGLALDRQALARAES